MQLTEGKYCLKEKKKGKKKKKKKDFWKKIQHYEQKEKAKLWWDYLLKTIISC